MPAVTRLGDQATGHESYPPHPSITASSKVFASGKGVVCVSDTYALHCSSGSCHTGNAIVGSPKVLASGKPKMKVGDPVSCGGTVAEGSPKVLIG